MYSTEVLLQWSSNRYKRTIPLDINNIGTLYSAPGYKKYDAFCAQIDSGTLQIESDLKLSYSATTIVTDQLEISENGLLTYDATAVVDEKEKQSAVFSKGTIMEMAEKLRDSGLLADFGNKMFLDKTSPVTDMNKTYSDIRKDEDLLLLLHQKYGHIPMVRLQRMAKLGMLPSRIGKCPIPICQSCIYGKMTRKQWRYKQTTNKVESKTATRPGQIVSVDQLESPIGGFIGQMKGRLYQKHRYKCATVFVDQYSGLSFVHLQQSTSAVETLEAKVAFEKYANTFGVSIMHYHADNGRFAESVWKDHIERKSQ